MEVLINILLTAIILGMVYFLYTSFVKQISIYQSSIKEQNELNAFCLQLKKDFFKASKIVNSDDGFKVVFYDTKSVDYIIAENYMYRKQNQRTDSLRIKKVSRNWVFMPKTKEELLNGLVMETMLFDNPVNYSLTKDYQTIIATDNTNGN